MILREYQVEMLQCCKHFLLEEKGNGIVAAVGGVGKSLVMNALMKWAVTTYPDTRCMLLCNDFKILNQNMNSMLKYWPQANFGCYSASLKRRDTKKPILYCGIQSVGKRPHEFQAPHIILVDEGDMVSDKDESLYQKFITAFPKARVIAFTATPYDSKGCMTNNPTWDKIIIDLTRLERFNKFVDDGILSPLVNKKTCIEIDITQIAMKFNDFDEKSANEAADHEEIHKAVVSECIKYGSDRKKWLVFSQGIQNGIKITKLFNAAGVRTVMLTGADTVAHREEQERLYDSGEIRCLVNHNLYARGWDSPEVDLIAVAKASQSTRWWIQALLRGTRRAAGKINTLVLDFAGNTRRLGPVNSPIIPQPRRKGDGEKGEAPLKVCDHCMSYVAIQCRTCPECGEEFPASTTVQKTASSDAIMAGTIVEPQIEEFYVRDISYKAGQSKKGTRYLKVTHGVGTQKFSEFKFFDSGQNYSSWWSHRGGQLPAPRSVNEAVDRAAKELTVPTVIRVDVAKKYPEIVGCDCDPDAKISDEREIEEDFIPY